MPNGVYQSREQVKKRLGSLLIPFWSGQRKYAGFGDDYFYMPTPEETVAFVANNPITPAQGASQAFDCDDYAFVFKGSVCLYVRDTQSITASMCLGIAWGRFAWKPEFHACNWVLDAQGTFHWIEPQTQMFYAVGGCTGDLELVLV